MKTLIDMVLFVCVLPFYYLGYIWAGIVSMFLMGMEDFGEVPPRAEGE